VDDAYRKDVRLLQAATVAHLGDHAVALAMLDEYSKETSKKGDLDYKRARISTGTDNG
jgi:hypothetical protein